MTTTFREWPDLRTGIEIRAALVKDVPYEATEGSGTEVADLWVLFLSISSNDRWIAYGVTDTLVGEPEQSLLHLPIAKLKKFSIIVGDRWLRIERETLQASQKHRRLMADLVDIEDDILAMSYMELLEKRVETDWEATALHWKKFGVVLSLN